MTAKKADGARILTVEGKTIPATYMEIPLVQVRLSPKNPRIQRLLRTNPKPTSEEIQRFLLDEDGVSDLQKQIRDNQGLVDPIIVNKDYEVIEGNCRAAIYQKLKDGRPQESQWSKIPAYVLDDSVTERQLLILQAIYHVHSNKIKWGAYEQQSHLNAMRTTLTMSSADIARVLGLSPGLVNTLLDAHAAMTKHYVVKQKPGEDRKVWSHFLELHKNPKLATFRGSDENLRIFAKLVKDGKIKKGSDVRKLPAIVADPSALKKLAKQGLDAAVREVGKGDPSQVYPLFKQLKKTTKLLKAVKREDVEELKSQQAEQKEFRALYEALVAVARAANIKLA
jgi:ParB-like chromosome segregation protein Spo0J